MLVKELVGEYINVNVIVFGCFLSCMICYIVNDLQVLEVDSVLIFMGCWGCLEEMVVLVISLVGIVGVYMIGNVIFIDGGFYF